jgi:hypothetical protein
MALRDRGFGARFLSEIDILFIASRRALGRTQNVLTVDKLRNCRNGVLLGAFVDFRVIAGTWLDVSSWNTQAP